MSNIFFTADHHFGHENIIKYCKRPFGSVEEMDETMIERWNEVVSWDDVVWHLGDLCLGTIAEALPYIKGLNGTIKILSLPWHHDRRWLPDFMDRASVLPFHMMGAEYVTKVGHQFIHLSHYPLSEWDRKHYGAWNLHGHSHGNHFAKEFQLDVGVDTNNFYPWSFDEVEELWAEEEEIYV